MGGRYLQDVQDVIPLHRTLTLAGELGDDVFLENASSHVTSCCFPTYALTTYTSPFLSSRFPVSHPLSFTFLSSASILS